MGYWRLGSPRHLNDWTDYRPRPARYSGSDLGAYRVGSIGAPPAWFGIDHPEVYRSIRTRQVGRRPAQLMRTAQTSPTGQRYVNHRDAGSRILLFRAGKKEVGVGRWCTVRTARSGWLRVTRRGTAYGDHAAVAAGDAGGGLSRREGGGGV